MYFSRSIVASAFVGFAAATTHAGEQAIAHSTALVASETLASLTATAAGVHPTAGGVAPAAGMVNTHVIQVGGPNGSLVFSPENVAAQPGDLIQFQFNPKNHSVVQSTFDNPCVPIQNIMPNKTDAFFSGFMPAAAAAAGGNGTVGGKLTYTIRVMDTKPIWFYCSQGQHCQAGMVGAINAAATGNRTMEAFKSLAASATENLSPGQVAGQGNTAQPSSAPGGAQPSGGAGGAPGPAGGSPTTTSLEPAQATVNAAPGRLSQSFLGLGMGGLVAFMML